MTKISYKSFSGTFGDLWGHWKRIFKSNIAMEEQIVNWPHKSYGSICLFSPYNIIYTHCELKNYSFSKPSILLLYVFCFDMHCHWETEPTCTFEE